MRIIITLFTLFLLISCKSKQADTQPTLTEQIMAADLENVPTVNGIDASLIEKYGPGAQMPTDVFYDAAGKEFSISQWKGKYVFVDFWATWCGPCIAEQPYIKKMRHAFKDDNVAFISISMDDDREGWKEFLVEKQLDRYEYWLGDRRNTPLHSKTYSMEEVNGSLVALMSLPTFTLIDPNGEIITREFSNHI